MDTLKSIDTMWVLVATCLVFFMQAGFAMVETGFTRAKNSGNIIMKNFMDFSVGSLIFWLFGFGLMFNTDILGFVGKINLFSNGTYEHLGLSIPIEAFIIFQTVFCATAATIVSGAMAERTKFASYLVFSFVISAVIYPVVGHWIWGGGWLAARGFHDFAGSTVVHSVGGWAALVGAKVLGPRLGKYEKGRSNAIPGHSITLGALGVFILWFGWFGFNPGSTLSMGNPTLVGHIFMTTNLSAAAGAVGAMAITWIKHKKPDVGMTLNGALAGLVGITAGTDAVSLEAAVVIGFLSGLIVVYVTKFVDEVLLIDDPVGAFAVHGACGVFGTLMVGVFATEGGLLYTGDISLLATQVIGISATAFWTISSSFVLFKVIDMTMGLRVSAREETLGLDLEEHGIVGYADFEIKKEKMVNQTTI
ncbi:ammonium transporter [Fusibacter sp. 3D3]|uniref:ammonium transporter n=1 Tax=Fusibacter sp. 3D3 TaxID=1048380 RepID=UPI00085298DE|nr:ammonium transporter [Fusibacter sp. 3D3]GAU79123.1 ammonium transporter [Fusibacter sp. 3D3]